MNYEFFLDMLYDHSFFTAEKMNLEFMEEFSKDFAAPEKTFPSIHVAGSNGKGSIVCKIAATLSKAGFKVGTYTSPHISSFRERICLNEVPILKEDVVKELKRLFAWLGHKDKKASFFEILTMLCYLYFSHQNVDIAVIETGMGGRLDATNIITPILTIITRITREHSQYLGDTLDQIANEKAGIIKSGVPLLLGFQARFPSILKKANVEQSPTHILTECSTYLNENRQIASKALELLSARFPVTDEALVWGLNQNPKCRLETYRMNGKEIIFDVAHNPDGIEALFRQLNLGKKIPMVIGLSIGKEIEACLDLFCQHASHLYLIQSSHQRMHKAEKLARYAKEKNVAYSLIFPGQVSLLRDEKLLVSGSFFFMGEVRQAIGIKEPKDFIDLNGSKLE